MKNIATTGCKHNVDSYLFDTYLDLFETCQSGHVRICHCSEIYFFSRLFSHAHGPCSPFPWGYFSDLQMPLVECFFSFMCVICIFFLPENHSSFPFVDAYKALVYGTKNEIRSYWRSVLLHDFFLSHTNPCRNHCLLH